MRWPGRVLLTILTFGLVAVSAPRLAQAQEKRIVLLEVEGARSPRLRRSLAKLIRDRHRIVSARSFERAARKRKARKLTPNNVKKVCRALPCDGILDGTIYAEDGSYKFIVRLREGATGRIAKKVTIRLAEPRLTRRIAGALRKRLLRSIRRLEPIERRRDRRAERFEEEPVDEGIVDEEGFDEERRAERRRRARARERARERARRRRERERERERRRRARDRERDEFEDDFEEDDFEEDDFEEDDFDDFEEDDFDEDEDRVAMRDEERDEDAEVEGEVDRAPDRDPRSSPVTLAAGVLAVSRELTFTYRAGLDDPPPGYDGGVVPAFYAVGRIYPLAFQEDNDSALSDLGFHFAVDRALSLSTSIDDGMGMQRTLGTTQQRIGGGVSYRYNFGDSPSLPTVIVSVGYNKLSFTVDKEQAIADGLDVDIPNTEYSYVDPGIAARVPVTDKLAVLAEGKFMLVMDAGEIQLQEQYGTATVTGGIGDLAVEYAIKNGFTIRIGGHATVLGYEFRGNGARTDRDNDGTADVGGARDGYYGGYGAIGYRY